MELRRSRTRCVCERRWPFSGDGDREPGLWLLGEGLTPLRFAEMLRALREIFRPGPPAADPGEPMSLSAAATSERDEDKKPHVVMDTREPGHSRDGYLTECQRNYLAGRVGYVRR